MSTKSRHDANDAATAEQEASAALRTADEVFQFLLDQDPEEQRHAWLEFRSAIDEDRPEGEKLYPWPEDE
jgi:hypothetical protein